MALIVVVLTFVFILSVHSDQLSLGQERYESLQRESTMPRFGPCWKDALQELESGCRHLTEDLQHRLALSFTNCFLLKFDKVIYKCNPQEEFASCTKDMTADAYNTYVEFFTHTQNMCYFLQSQVWQEETDITIDRLADSSKHVANQLENSSKLQSEVIEKQNLSLKNQEIFMQRGAELKEMLEDSKLSVHNMLSEFKDATTQQRALIFEVFDRVRVLQSLVMGEFTGFYSLVFYSLSVVISYLLTSTQRTSAARFWLFVILTVNVFFERFIAYIGASQKIDEAGNILDEGSVVYGRLWICRKIFTTLAVSVWLFFAWRYRDINQINNQLLEEIRKQNSDLKHLLQGSAQGTGARPSVNSGNKADKLFIKEKSEKTSDGHCFGPLRDISTTGYETYSESSRSTSDDSSDSELSDRTYVYDGGDSDTDSNNSFWTSISERSSRASTPTLLDEVADLRCATPLREMTPIPGVTIAETSINSSRHSDISDLSAGAIRRGPGRPRGSTRRSLPVSTNLVHRYNLRSRKGAVPIKPNPIVETESARDFKKLVKHYNDVSSRNRAKVMATVERQQQHTLDFFSDND